MFVQGNKRWEAPTVPPQISPNPITSIGKRYLKAGNDQIGIGYFVEGMIANFYQNWLISYTRE